MKIRKLLIITLILAIVLTGCRQLPAQVAAQQEERMNREYNENEMYLVLASRKQEVCDVYTNEIFSVKINEQGDTYENAFDSMVRDYMTKMYVMTRMCEEREIEINTTDLRGIEERAEQFIEDFKSAGNTLDITKDDATQILKDLYLIDLLKESIIKESDTEVSESDARVMDIIRITLDNSERANSVLEEVSADDIDFAAAARRNSTDSEIELKVAKGDLEPSIEEVVFGLEDGEISPIVQLNGKYYIIKCVSGYDEEATAAKREKMMAVRRDEVVAHAYDEYFNEHEYALPDETWNKAVKMCKESGKCPDIFEY